MGAIKMQDGQNHFEVHYGGKECPFTGGGLDSSAPPAYIAPNAFTAFNNAVIVDNQIVMASLEPVNVNAFQFGDTAGFCIGMGDLNGVPFEVHFDTTLGTYGTLQVYSYGVGSLNAPTLIGTFALTIATTVGSLTYKNINGICYFSASGLYNIYTHNNVYASVLTSYLGCSFLGELNGRLLALNVAQINYTGNISVINFNPATQTANASSNTTGTTTVNSAVFTYSGSTPIPSTYINVTLYSNLGYVITVGSGSASCTINCQYSVDSGATWNTYSTFNTNANASNSLPADENPTPPFSFYVANVNTVQVRVQAVIIAYVNGGYLIQAELGQVQILTPPITNPALQYFPYQIAWSAAQGAYSIFNPLDSNNLVTGAGYNNLPDVEDTISGFFTTGPTGYILRLQGISEMSPLNSGTQPFDFNHLWASHKGIGALYSESVQQYGSVGYFVSDTDIFTIGYDGINVIAGKSKSAIYSWINNENFEMDSAIGVISINNEPFLAYVLAFYGTTSAAGYVQYFIFRADNKEWYSGQLNPLTGNYTSFNLSLASVELPSLTLGISSSIVFNCQGVINSTTGYSTNLYIFPNFPIPPPLNETTLVFPAEELGFGKLPTIDALGFYLYSPGTYLISSVNLIISVNNITYNTITLASNSTFPVVTDQIQQGWNYYFAMPDQQTQGYTGTSPQISLSVRTIRYNTSVNGIQFVIGKVVMFGTIDPTQRPI